MGGMGDGGGFAPFGPMFGGGFGGPFGGGGGGGGGGNPFNDMFGGGMMGGSMMGGPGMMGNSMDMSGGMSSSSSFGSFGSFGKGLRHQHICSHHHELLPAQRPSFPVFSPPATFSCSTWVRTLSM